MDNTNASPTGINDNGARISYGEGKAIREPSVGKGRYDLISPFAVKRLAHWYELGASKYEDRNWEKGIPYSRCIDSAKRHLDKYIMGMSDEDHLAAAVWNIFSILHYEELGMDELDDMPHYLQKDSNKCNRSQIDNSCINCTHVGVDGQGKYCKNTRNIPDKSTVLEDIERAVDGYKETDMVPISGGLLYNIVRVLKGQI